MRRRRRWLSLIAAAGVLAGVVPGCGQSDGSEFDPATGKPPVDLGETGTFVPGNTDGGACGVCPTGLTCIRDVCLPPQGPCNPDAGLEAAPCKYDTYCEAATNTCIPYGSRPEGRVTDPRCKYEAPPGTFAPTTKCAFPETIPIVGDRFPDLVDVQATPTVARLNGPIAPPSIVAPFAVALDNGYTEIGVVRVIRGTDCAQEAVLGGTDLDSDGLIDFARASSSAALADLDGDGTPEIVVYTVSVLEESLEWPDSIIAFTRRGTAWVPFWPSIKATNVDGSVFKASFAGESAGPSIHDLDDDGKPEIIREGWVFDGATGRLRAAPPANYQSYRAGTSSVLANLDGDPAIELANGAHVWQFNGASNTWTEEPSYSQTTPSQPGWVAIADLDPYDLQKKPEIAVASSGVLEIFKSDHSLFMNMRVPVPGGGGGPPTIADFDGDGLPEIALAGRATYTVFDPDCQATPRPGGKCADRTHCDFAAGGVCPEGILWSRSTQDFSSSSTGSSIFDFEADGKAEAIYADECFARVYSGLDGRVLYSRFHSSCTWQENPIVADVDGDFRAELVVPNNTSCGPVGAGIACTANIDAQGVDAQFAGLPCEKASECVSGVCDRGLCRCTTSADCCGDRDVGKCEEFGTKCADAPAGTAGTGKTCRANRPKGLRGIRVYEDGGDRWVRSRTIWNQHAYAVTHVNEDGTIPRTSSWANNWTTPDLNNFRQNVPGTASTGTDSPDLTAQVVSAFTCSPTNAAILSDQVCNRGSSPVAAGVKVGFYAGTDKVCSAATVGVLLPGTCEKVSCTWASPPGNGAGADVRVVPNDGAAIKECSPGNNDGLIVGVRCSSGIN